MSCGDTNSCFKNEHSPSCCKLFSIYFVDNSSENVDVLKSKFKRNVYVYTQIYNIIVSFEMLTSNRIKSPAAGVDGNTKNLYNNRRT